MNPDSASSGTLPVSDGGVNTEGPIDCGARPDIVSEHGIDLSDRIPVEYDSPRPEEPYFPLSDEQERRIRESLVELYDSDALDQVLHPLYAWKEGASPTDADVQTHEKLVQQALSIERDVRGEDDLWREPGPTQVEMMKDIYCISRAFLQENDNFEADIEIFRGISYSTPIIAKRILMNPQEEEFGLETSVLSNFTINELHAWDYSDILVRAEVPFESVAIASDHLFKYKRNDEVAKRDAEMRICGDRIPVLPEDHIYINIGDDYTRPLKEMLSDVTEFTEEEHVIMSDIVHGMARRRIRFEEGSGRETLRRWNRQLQLDRIHLAEELDDLIQYVIARREEPLAEERLDEIEGVLGRERRRLDW